MNEIEQVNNGCILVKKKEYEQLKAQIIQLKSSIDNNKIKLDWNPYWSYWNNQNVPELELRLYSEIRISDKISTQLYNIVGCIKTIQRYHYEKELEFRSKKQLQSFKTLSWYKRLFFKESYLK